MSKIKKPKKTKLAQSEPRTAPLQKVAMVHGSVAPIEEITHVAVSPAVESVSVATSDSLNTQGVLQSTHPTQTDVGGIFDEKAPDTGSSEGVLELLAFRLANEEYAVDLLKIKEIIRFVEITRVPRTPSAIKGIISLRGTIVPAFDLRIRLGLEESPPERKTRIVVVMLEKGLMGLIVDEVTDVIKIKANEIETPPSVVGGSESEHLIGVVRSKGHLLILLDLEKALVLEQ